jgi:hypothetical protein
MLCYLKINFQKERVDKGPSRGLETGLARQSGNRRPRTRRNRATGDFGDGSEELAHWDVHWLGLPEGVYWPVMPILLRGMGCP